MQERAYKLRSGSSHLVELAASEGETSKNQFIMFTKPIESC